MTSGLLQPFATGAELCHAVGRVFCAQMGSMCSATLPVRRQHLNRVQQVDKRKWLGMAPLADAGTLPWARHSSPPAPQHAWPTARPPASAPRAVRARPPTASRAAAAASPQAPSTQPVWQPAPSLPPGRPVRSHIINEPYVLQHTAFVTALRDHLSRLRSKPTRTSHSALL